MDIKYLKKMYHSLSEQVKASIWYTICNVLNKGIALLSTPIFTRILTEEQYGIFSVFQSWYSIIFIFTSLNVFLGSYTKGLLLYKDRREEFTSSLLCLTTVITCCFGMIFLINIDFWSSVFELPSILLFAMFIELIFMPALEFWSAKERFDFKYINYVIVSVAMTSLSFTTSVIAVVLLKHKVEARIYSDVFSKVIFSIIIYIMIFLKGKKLFVREYWIYAIKFNIPLIPHYLSNYILSQSDRIMISKMVGNIQAAYYSLAYSIATMMNLIIIAINNSLTPYIYHSIDEGEEKSIDKVTTPVLLMVGSITVLTMIFAPEIIRIFAGKKYMEAIYVIPPIAASVFFIFVYSMFSTIEYYYQRTGLIAIATCISAGINLVLNFLFIKSIGYYAAGYTTLICYIFLSLMHYLFYKKTIEKELPRANGVYDTKMIMVVSIVVLAMMTFMIVIYQLTIMRYMIALIFVLIAYKKRNFSSFLLIKK